MYIWLPSNKNHGNLRVPPPITTGLVEGLLKENNHHDTIIIICQYIARPYICVGGGRNQLLFKMSVYFLLMLQSRLKKPQCWDNMDIFIYFFLPFFIPFPSIENKQSPRVSTAPPLQGLPRCPCSATGAGR